MPENIVQKESPNFTVGRKSHKPEAVVIHIMEGTLSGTDSWFLNPKSEVSAHYGIGLNGEIHQYVKEENAAWHSGRVADPSWKLIKKGTTKGFVNPNYYTIGIEHEGNESSNWPDSMYAASAALIKDICDRNAIPIDRDHIIGHHEIYSKKTCPGHIVNIDRLISLAGGTVVNTDDLQPNLAGSVIVNSRLRIRTERASLTSPVSKLVNPGTTLQFSEVVQGDMYQNSSEWYTDGKNSFWWSGACTRL